MFLEELLDLKNRYPERFEMVNVLSREPQDVELLSGRLDPERSSLRSWLPSLLSTASTSGTSAVPTSW